MRLHALALVVVVVGAAACGSNHETPIDGGGLPIDGPPGMIDSPPAGCGDGQLETGEQCDDGNTVGGDGCSATCQLEPGWYCPTLGSACIREAYCGDGIVESGEQCDDGNSIPGDGCSGTCQVEPNYTCSGSPSVCSTTIVCGDGIIEGDEVCDDGNVMSGDGCSGDCSEVEAGYICPTAGSACEMVMLASCGDGVIQGSDGEVCDDGNNVNGDGCRANCTVEKGWTCSGEPSTCTPLCGNGVVDTSAGEACDMGSALNGSSSGCSTSCQVESGFACLGSPSACTYEVVCGDGRLEGSETCDLGSDGSGHSRNTGLDGCNSDCTTASGWTCPVAGNAAKCIAADCGDGIVAGTEQCDLGSGNGSSSGSTGAYCGSGSAYGPYCGCTATCTITSSFTCTGSGCAKPVCGNGIQEGLEECDDGNTKPYDGCSPTCTLEPHCAGGTCTAVCGDGLLFGSNEQCDDGNTTSGDGCSSTCQIESGWDCTTVVHATPTTLSIPILYRDMLFYDALNSTDTAPTTTMVNYGSATYTGSAATGVAVTHQPLQGHPDFENHAFTGGGLTQGLVGSALGADSEPIWAADDGVLTGSAAFCWWYHDTGCAGSAGSANPYAFDVYIDGSGNPTQLVLTETGSNTNVYQFGSAAFFPVDNLGWNKPSVVTSTGFGPQLGSDDAGDNKLHNFSFSSELHYPFTYNGSANAQFQFTGDDDVWVFINGRLVVDIGGIHGGTDGTVTLGSNGSATYSVNGAANKTIGIGLTDGDMYSIDVFQAERNVTGSHYKLTLSNFTHATSTCATDCGDGIIAGSEQCDNGSDGSGDSLNVGGYGSGHCNANCTLTPYCGDGHVDGGDGEQCDDGINVASYGGDQALCGPGCMIAPYCGDGVVDPTDGEACDGSDFADPADSPYGCNPDCTLASYCGDGVTDTAAGEQCDDGSRNGMVGDPCSAACRIDCGDGIIEAGEQCDLGSGSGGTSLNVGGYGSGTCTPSCKLGPYCGDGIKEGSDGEQCDNSVNDGTYGTCSPGCVLAPYCGDGIINGAEQCDNGSANSNTAYGSGGCTKACQSAPYCGDGIVESSFGEQCDGTSGCTSSCTYGIQ